MFFDMHSNNIQMGPPGSVCIPSPAHGWNKCNRPPNSMYLAHLLIANSPYVFSVTILYRKCLYINVYLSDKAHFVKW